MIAKVSAKNRFIKQINLLAGNFKSNLIFGFNIQNPECLFFCLIQLKMV